MPGEIRIDYDATMKMAQELESVNELLSDAVSRDATMQQYFTNWDGEAAASARQTLEALHETLSSFEGFDQTITGHFISAAEKFTEEDEKEAAAIEAEY